MSTSTDSSTAAPCEAPRSRRFGSWKYGSTVCCVADAPRATPPTLRQRVQPREHPVRAEARVQLRRKGVVRQ
ncbi:hypothetical protein [Streptomyces dysideae]|uniref:hypothetical protein n=1 Tax=Streptomyces dysideae TaxID=909626 RepID=UPI0018FEFFE4|nr:hypothetical protein [Streptomyces dysideae]